MSVQNWSTSAASNLLSATGVNFDEGQTPGSVNNSAREMMAQLRTYFNSAGLDAQAVVGMLGMSGFLYGLTLSNNSGDATNDIDIAAGTAIDGGNARFMRLTSSLTKRLDAAWSVGSGNGGLDTGSIANTTYHIWLIMRSDTGVVDALFSTSASSPTMPANYDYKRRIGSIIRSGATILAFFQDGDHFRLKTSVTDRSSTSAVAISALALTVPGGIVVWPLLLASQVQNTAGNILTELADGTWTSDAVAAAATRAAGEQALAQFQGMLRTDTSSQIRIAVTIGSGTLTSNALLTLGWIDKRGRVA